MRIEKTTNLILYGILGILCAILGYALYKNHIYQSGLSRTIFPRHYLFLLGGAVLATALMFRLPQEHKINTILATLSTGIGILLIEVVLFLTHPNMLLGDSVLRLQRAQDLGIAYDRREPIEVVDDFRAKGLEAYPAVPSGLFTRNTSVQELQEKVVPLGGLSQTITVYCNETGRYSIWTSDQHGFNNPPNLSREKPIDYVLLGDSFTQGACVDQGEDIAGRLRSLGNSAINLGSRGNGPLHELATLIEYAKPLKPRKVLWIYYEGNDLINLQSELQRPLLIKYLETDFSQGLIERQGEIDTLLRSFLEKKYAEEKNKQAASETSVIKSLLKLQRLRFKLEQLFQRNPIPPPPPLFEAVLSKAKTLTEGWGGELVFVYLGTHARYAGEVHEEDFCHRGEVLRVVRDLEIPIVDIHHRFLEHPNPITLFPFRLHGHYTAEGYELIAESIQARFSTL